MMEKPEEKAARREAFRKMSLRGKADYLFTYYKGPILFILVLFLILGYGIHRRLTTKEPVLYAALVNVTAGPDLSAGLGENYLTAEGHDPRREEVYFYRDLYLSENASPESHEYAYASRLKLMGAIQAEKLDVVIMNREAYDIFSWNGYLLDLEEYLQKEDPSLHERLAPYLAENRLMLKDNDIEVKLGTAQDRVTEEKTVRNGILAGSLPLFREAGLDGSLYLGIVANSPRDREALSWISYLLTEDMYETQ